MPPKFADDDKISEWAKPSVYFMASHNIIGGIGNNIFAPRAITSAEQASGYASATREQALAISLRITENLEDGSAASQIVTEDSQSSQSNGTIVGKWYNGMIGSRYNITTGRFEFGMYGTRQEYYFNEDGTFQEIITSGLGSVTRISGNYSVSNDKISFMYKSGEVSTDFGKTWAAGNVPPSASSYYEKKRMMMETII